MKFASTLIYLFVFCRVGWGGEYHYKDTLIGERASGLGGAFVALSDDPSGLYHNPAGILFSPENYFSLATNAYTDSQLRYKDIYPGQDYVYRSSGLSPTFFGFTQSFGKKKAGFAIIVPNSDQIDQSDTVTSTTAPAGQNKSFTRKFFRQDTTYLIGPGLAFELQKNLSVGLSAFGMFRTYKTIDNTTVFFEPIGTGKYVVHQVNTNQTSYGLVPKLGVEYMPIPKISLGLAFTYPFSLGGKGAARRINTKIGTSPTPPTPNGNFDNDMESLEADLISEIPTPFQISMAGAYFFSKIFLLTAQVDYHSAQESYVDFPIRQIINWSGGMEYYLSSAFAARFGIFSNNARSNPVDTNGKNQAPHVNQLGASASLSFYRTGSSLTLSAAYMTGSGLGQAIGNVVNTQTLEQKHLAFYVSGGYQM